MEATLDVWSALSMEIVYRTFYTSFLQRNNSLCHLVSEENIFQISANQKQEFVHGDQICFGFNQDEKIEDLP
jgi:hypothetical protein